MNIVHIWTNCNAGGQNIEIFPKVSSQAQGGSRVEQESGTAKATLPDYSMSLERCQVVSYMTKEAIMGIIDKYGYFG